MIEFIVACIIIGLEYIHSNEIIHRDIKPENLIFDSDGYLKITDFGIARTWTPENSQDTSGTPGYMAPEVMCRQNHGVAADYFALGVIAYECMLGKRPYYGKTRKEIRDQILAKQATIKPQELPEGWSLDAIDFINRVNEGLIEQLLQRKPSLRLGLNGPSEAKKHPWLQSISWQGLYEHQLTAPFIPNVEFYGIVQGKEDNFDAKYANDTKKDIDDAAFQSNVVLKDAQLKAIFAEYYYDYTIATAKNNSKTSKGDEKTKEPINTASIKINGVQQYIDNII